MPLVRFDLWAAGGEVGVEQGLWHPSGRVGRAVCGKAKAQCRSQTVTGTRGLGGGVWLRVLPRFHGAWEMQEGLCSEGLPFSWAHPAAFVGACGSEYVCFPFIC